MTVHEAKLEEGGKTFAELKNELFFNEKRLALLLRGSLHPEIEYWLKEKSFARGDCKSECESCAVRLDQSVAGKMRGVWNDVKVVQAFDVEVGLRDLLGSAWYEKPSPFATRDTAALIERIRELGSMLPGGDASEEMRERVGRLVGEFEALDWDRRDLARLSDAMQAKETLLREISELMKCLQELGWNCSVHEAKREELRRKVKKADKDGEVSRAQQYQKEQLDVVEGHMQLLLFKLQTIESSQSENAIKRRNNVSQWKLAAAQLETLKEQKLERQRECLRDKGRLTRGKEYEARKHDRKRAEFKDRRREVDERCERLAARQDELQQHLDELARQFREVETQLVTLCDDRMEAVTARVDVVEEEAQRVADYQEFCRFVDEHLRIVDHTATASGQAARVINELQRFLMNEQDYDEHDFYQTTRLLSDLKHKALVDLNHCYNDYHSGSMRNARLIENQIKKAEDEAARQQLLAEVSKETLNPEAKRHITAAREEIARREELLREKGAIMRKLEFIKSNYLRKVKEELPPEQIVEVDDDIEYETLQKRADLLDMREELIYPVEYQILDEREDIAAMADKARGEREADANRQVRKGEGRMAILLRKEVQRTRAGDDVSAPEPAGEINTQTLAEHAKRQHEAELVAEARAWKDRQDAERRQREEQAAARIDRRPVAASYSTGVERKAAEHAAAKPAAAAADAPPADAAADAPADGDVRPLEARYGPGVFPPEA
eukprot:TRINITY_DN59932_c0_g1_i1.p1 TRINITY_DN59932_c0_g1~~TRINITY_DN59932_c0_g1_i1.p1  ORF type:complete len:728 (+),score=383.46 TRINITY_DN59932_c0_g1_i1:88-2271(+)